MPLDYVEFPFDPLVRVVVPQKPDPNSCGGETPAPPFCNTYSYLKNDGGSTTGDGGYSTHDPLCPPGSQPCRLSADPSDTNYQCIDLAHTCAHGVVGAREFVVTESLAPTPLAGNLSPAPLFGSFTMSGVNGSEIPGIPGVGDEGQLRSYYAGSGGTAPPNQDAIFLYLTEQEITFTTQYLTSLAASPGTPGLVWGVDMALGGTVHTFPSGSCFIDVRIVDSWDIACYPAAGDTGGLGISHPRDDGIGMTKPTATVMTGAGTWHYKMHWGSYAFRGTGLGDGSMINAGNEHDPNTPGPIYLWWTSSPGAYFMGSDPLASTNSYTWTIKANCFGLYECYLEDGIISPGISADEYVEKYLIPYRQYAARQRLARRVPSTR